MAASSLCIPVSIRSHQTIRVYWGDVGRCFHLPLQATNRQIYNDESGGCRMIMLLGVLGKIGNAPREEKTRKGTQV